MGPEEGPAGARPGHDRRHGGRAWPASGPPRPARQPPAGDDDTPDLGAGLDRDELVAPLGRGGMGCVYLAEHTLIGRKVPNN